MARLHLGFDEVGLLIESFLGQPIPPPGETVGITGIVTKSLVEFAVAPADIQSVQTEGRWQRGATIETS